MGRTFVDIRRVIFKNHNLIGVVQYKIRSQSRRHERVGHARVVLMDEAPMGFYEHAFALLRDAGCQRRSELMAMKNFFKQTHRFDCSGRWCGLKNLKVSLPPRQ